MNKTRFWRLFDVYFTFTIIRFLRIALFFAILFLILGTIITTIRNYDDKNNNNNTITSNK